MKVYIRNSEGLRQCTTTRHWQTSKSK